MRLMKAKQLPMAATAGADPAIFCWGSGGGGGWVQTLVLKGLLNFFCGKLLLPHTPSHSLPPVAVAQIIGGCPDKTIAFFNIPGI